MAPVPLALAITQVSLSLRITSAGPVDELGSQWDWAAHRSTVPSPPGRLAAGSISAAGRILAYQAPSMGNDFPYLRPTNKALRNAEAGS